MKPSNTDRADIGVISDGCINQTGRSQADEPVRFHPCYRAKMQHKRRICRAGKLALALRVTPMSLRCGAKFYSGHRALIGVAGGCSLALAMIKKIRNRMQHGRMNARTQLSRIAWKRSLKSCLRCCTVRLSANIFPAQKGIHYK